MLSSFEGTSIDSLMLLHVGGINEEIKRLSSQHRFDIRIVMFNMVAFRLAFGPLRFDIAKADHLDEGGLRQLRQVLIGNATAANQAGADAFG